jgi:hypothetical protein
MPAAGYIIRYQHHYYIVYILYYIYPRLIAKAMLKLNMQTLPYPPTTLKDVKYLTYIYKERKRRYIFAAIRAINKIID